MKVGFLAPLNFDVGKLYKQNINAFYATPWTFNLIEGLNDYNIKVDLISWTNKIAEDYSYEEGKVRIKLFKSPSKVKQIFSFGKSNYLQCKNSVDLEGYDIIHAQDLKRSAIVGKNFNKPLVATIHGTMKDHFTGLNANKIYSLNYIQSMLFEKISLNLIKYAICVSPYIEEVIKSKNKKIKTWQIDNAISKEYFKNFDLKFYNEILFVGSITYRKQADIIVRALEQIPDIKLKLIYQYYDKNYYNFIKSIIKDKKLSNRVVFLGRKNKLEIINELKKSSALILPSRYESFGMVLAEAMAVGIPVIATNVAGIPHLIKNEETGFLINVGDLNQLVEIIRTLIGNKEYARKIGQNAKKAACLRWHPKIIAQKTIEVYKEIIG